ncbi:hypothetical protein AVEN_225688-1 [Araneus ventricosus]|uniref:Uncharacterized protein n=1 Tax=Araneus ventricosus TaxID=182803 RepID=A0A4Y2BNL6_ARAVE|nr:hypothetical protein AVEN_225688-1 [Araneus ventricosus]
MRHFGAIPDENSSLSDKNPFIGRSLCDRVSMKGLSMADDILLLGKLIVGTKGKKNLGRTLRQKHLPRKRTYTFCVETVNPSDGPVEVTTRSSVKAGKLTAYTH